MNVEQAELKVGIAGYGTVGKIRHKAIDEHPQMRVIAVCDQVFPEMGVAEGGVRCYPSYHALLNEELDAVFVCLPNYLAPEVTIAALELGVHAFCEKPPGRDLADVIRVREAERRCPSQKLMYGFNHRYHDSVRDALQIIRGGELGRIIDMRGVYGKSAIIKFEPSEWRTQRVMAGGGILLDQGIHLVDMMLLFADEDFEVLASHISNDYWNHDVEDNAYALMRTPSGIVAMLHSSATQWRHRFNLDINLERGAVLLSGILTSTRSYAPETITIVYAEEGNGGDPREQMTRYNRDPSWRDEVFEFAAAVLENREISFGSSEEALRTMELVYQIYCADRKWAARYSLTDTQPAAVQ